MRAAEPWSGAEGALVRAVAVVLCDVQGEPSQLPKWVRVVEGGEGALARSLEPWVDRKRGKLLAEDVLLAHRAVAAAFEEVDADPPRSAGPRTGVFVGTRLTSRMDRRLGDTIARAGSGPRPDCAEYFRGLAKGVNPVRLLSYVSHRAAPHLAISLGAQGSVGTWGGSGLASATALRQALAAIRRGEVDRAIVGGVDAGRDPVGEALEVVAGAAEPAAGVAAFAVLERATHDAEPAHLGRLLSVEVATGDGAGAATAAARRALAAAGLSDAPALELEVPSAARGKNGATPLLLACALERLAARTEEAPAAAVCTVADERAGSVAGFVVEVP